MTRLLLVLWYRASLLVRENQVLQEVKVHEVQMPRALKREPQKILTTIFSDAKIVNKGSLN